MRTVFFPLFSRIPKVGLEPTRPYKGHRILSPERLPFRHFGIFPIYSRIVRRSIYKIMSATTTEGTGPGAVDRVIPRIYNNQIRPQNIINFEQVVQEVNPRTIDGGEIRAMMMGLSEEDMKTILKAAEILKSLGK